ncbi:MAG: general secretion pathway protein K [Bacteroidia bacterium]
MVIAMLVFALTAALVVAMQSEFSRLFARSAGVLITAQAQAYLRGAEDLATMALLADYDKDQLSQKRDDLTEIWAQEAAPYALDEGGWMTGSLEDLQGRFNLNTLTPPTRKPQSGQFRYTPHQAQFIRLLQALGEPELSDYEAIAITDAIGDWLDKDTQPSPEGAEDDFYFSRDPPHRAANRDMSSASELLAVANVTPELYLALAPLVTVLPPDVKTLNIHTASGTLLRSINSDKDLTPLSESEAESLVEFREENGFADVKALMAHPVFAGKTDIGDTEKLLGESTAYFLLSAELDLAQRNMRLYSVLHRDNREIKALARASGSL